MKRIEIPINNLIKQYNSGYSTKYLAGYYNCSIITIQRKLRNAKDCNFRPIGHGSKKYKVNETFFDIIDNEDKSYWLGIMLTDGSTSGKLVRLSFKKDDESHLKKFLASISSTHPIKHQNKEGFIQSYVSIGNKHMRDSLIYKGIITKDKKVFKLPPELERHYWRGAIDGDGRLDFKTNTIGLVGTKETCQAFKIFCQKHVKTKAHVRKHGNIWSFRLHGNLAFELAEILYDNSSIYLDRKYQEYINWSSLHKNKPIYPRAVRFFKKFFHNVDLSIVRCKMPKYLEGECSCCEDGKYFIRIDKNLSDNEAINCLIHEVSHIETMLKQKDPHGSAFGIAYSKMYKLYESEFT
jgi:hypothetical protein